MRTSLIFRFVMLTALFVALPAACGARTQLGVPEDGVSIEIEASISVDARLDVRADTRVDADARPDVLPGIDAARHDVVVPDDCPDGGGTLVYLLTEEGQLLSFYPPTRTFHVIGGFDCGTKDTPHSMAVDRLGTAYVLLGNLGDPPRGALYQISTRTAACVPIAYDDNASGFHHFGMGFVARNGVDELYVTDNTNDEQGLARIDTTTFGLTRVGPYDSPIGRCELTGTGDGRLFAYCVPDFGGGSTISEIDPDTAHVVASDHLDFGTSADGFAFAFWGGRFYAFNSPGNGRSIVREYDPATKTTTEVARYAATIVGAGVSTCAPL